MKTKPCPICQRQISTVGRRFGAHLEKHERDGIKERIALRKEALRLFRVVHGSGDDGSEHEFDCLNGMEYDGWLRLAKETLRK